MDTVCVCVCSYFLFKWLSIRAGTCDVWMQGVLGSHTRCQPRFALMRFAKRKEPVNQQS